jgi:hypothetical protein
METKEALPTEQTAPIFSGDVTGLERAARELTANREAAEPEAEGPGTPKDDAPAVDLDESIKLKDGAAELAEWRRKRDEEREKFNAAVMGEEAPKPEEEDVSSLSIEDQYQRAADAFKKLQDELGITSETDRHRAELDRRIADAEAKVAHFKSLVDEQQRKDEPPPNALVPQHIAQNLKQHRLQVAQALLNRFPEARDSSAMARMQYENPVRFEEYKIAYRAADESVRAAQGQAIAAEHDYARQFNRLAAREDEAFAKSHPELTKNPQAAEAIKAEAIQLLKAGGMSEDDIVRSWNGVGPFPWIRAAGMQEILLQAARQSLAKKGMKAPARRPVPPVTQRPGVAGELRRDPTADLQRRLDKTGSIRDAARLLAARRRG